MESSLLIDQSGEWIESGPDWNPDVLPIKYAGAAIRWSTTHFDSVVIPLIVTTKQVFWGLRLSAFEITDHVLKIIIDLPSIHGPAMEVVSFNETDTAPAGRGRRDYRSTGRGRCASAFQSRGATKSYSCKAQGRRRSRAR